MLQVSDVPFTDEQLVQLHNLAQATGKSEAELIVEAVEQLIQQHNHTRRLAALQGIRGLWRDRTDLPDWEALRQELDRFADE